MSLIVKIAVRTLGCLLLLGILFWPGYIGFGRSGINAIANPANAGQLLRYVPPKLPPRGSPKRTQGTGSRGPDCIPLKMVLLAPATGSIGQTTMGHPNFFIHIAPDSKYISDSQQSDSRPLPFTTGARPVLLQFRLGQPTVEEQPLMMMQIPVEQAGLVKVEMPKSLPELISGQAYRWSVSTECSQTQQSGFISVLNWVQRVDLKPELAKQLKVVMPDRDRAVIYAQSGLWYDALNEVANRYLDQPNDSTRSDLATLLNQVELSPALELTQ